MNHPSKKIKASPVQMGVSALSMAGLLMRDFLAKEAVLTTEQERTRRLEACGQCPSYRRDGRCAECGCYTPMKVKFIVAHCDKERW